MDASHDNEILRAANEALARSVKHLKQDLAEMRESEVEMNAALSRAQAESATLRHELKKALSAAAADRAVAEAADKLVLALDLSTPTWRTALDEVGMVPSTVRVAWAGLIAALDARCEP